MRTEEGRSYFCRARGRLKRGDRSILVGDRVKFQPGEQEEPPGVAERGSLADDPAGVIEELLPRRTILSRPPVANVEQLVLVMALKSPPPDWQLAGRISVQAEREGLNLLCCLNKVDLVDASEREAVLNTLELLPYPLLWCSARKGSGIDELKEKLLGRFTVFAGPSGAGKSSLLNAVQPGLALNTGKVSERIGRGRHITRHAEILALHPRGFVVDTPGFSRLSLAGVKPGELDRLFPEFDPYLESCNFRDCHHIHEPGCAVREAASRGLLNPCRYRQYRRLWQEFTDKER